MTLKILVVNGPNLNLLGRREPETYGTATHSDIESLVEDVGRELGVQTCTVQSNHEGVLIDAIQAARDDCTAIVINAGALTHTSVAIRDALLAVGLPIAEVHISNVYRREEFRHRSYISDIAQVVIAGAGIDGYAYAIRHLAEV